MNREEKNMLMKQQIIKSAIEEFGIHAYSDASLNAICKRGNISKGIIYHYFKNKDELYIVCVGECFDNLTTFLNSNRDNVNFNNAEEAVENIIDLRHQFYEKNPDLGNIITNALLQPPKHLVDQIKEVKSGLDNFNINFYEKVLQNVNLKKEISREEAIEFFSMFQESFNHYFKNKAYGNLGKLFDEHELKLKKLLKIMFYGMVREEKD